jgi:hypothetical protein
VQQIEAENDLINTWMHGSSVLGKRQREDEAAAQALIEPLI